MKKFLVLFLLVSLVPFTVGCRLFDKGDDDHAAPASAVFSGSVLVPAPAVPGAGSIRAAASEADWTVTIDGVQVAVTGITGPDANDMYKITFSQTLSIANFNKVTAAGKTVSVKTAAVEIQFIATAGLGNGAVIEIETKADGTLGVKTVKTAAGDEVEVTVPESFTPVKVYKVETIKYGTQDLGKSIASATTVTTTTPTFVVEFNQDLVDVTTSTWKVRVQRVEPTPAGTAFELTTGTALTVAAGADSKTANITVDQHETYRLEAGKTYMVEVLEATNDGNKLTVPAARYIKVQ